MKEDGWLIGYGMGSGTFGAGRGRATVKPYYRRMVTFVIQSAVSDKRTRNCNILLVLHQKHLSPGKITFELGDLCSHPTNTSR